MKRSTTLLCLGLVAACSTAGPQEGTGPLGGVGDDSSLPDPVDPDASTGDDGDGDDDESSSDSGASEPAGDPDALDDFILGLGHLDIDTIADKHEIACPGVCASWPEGELTCTQTYFSETDQLDTFIALQPNSPALWPGAVLRGDELEQGFLAPIGLERAPAVFSLSLENLTASPVGMMDTPSLSSFRELRNQILAEGTTGATPAQVAYDITTVKSDSQLAVKVGADVGWSGVLDLKAMFDFEDGELENKYLFDFTQTYYTVDLDVPLRPSALFADGVSVEDFEGYAGEGNPPVYVVSISYGRRVLFGLESNESMERIAAAVDAAVASVLNVDFDATATEALVGSKITAAVLGGDGDGAVKTVLGIEQLLEYITTGGNYSLESPGVPIAYKLAYLDNAPARLALTSEYPEVSCE